MYKKYARVDLSGEKFGRLNVLYRDGIIHTHAAYICECECGNRRRIPAHKLKSGATLSCGCLRSELAGGLNRTHGLRHTRTYEAWKDMKRKASSLKNAKQKPVCERWSVFENFLEDMGLSSRNRFLYRKDPKQGYNPENCIWATSREMMRHRRYRRRLTRGGVTKTAKEWAKEFHMSPARFCTLLEGSRMRRVFDHIEPLAR